MESKRYENMPGGGVATFPTTPDPASPASLPPQLANVCTFVGATGNRCHMLIVHPDQRLCPDHLNKQRRAEQRHTHDVATSLFENMHDFTAPTSVNIFLGNLLREVALKRIDRKDAMAMAYIGQLLLNSHADIDRFYKFGFDEKNYAATVLLAKKRNLEDAQSANGSPAAPPTSETPRARELSETDEIPKHHDTEKNALEET